MKFYQQLKVIDLPRNQWKRIGPWPIRVLLALLTLVDWCSSGWLRLNQTVANGRAAIRIAAIALRITARVAWADLSYSLARLFIGPKLANLPAAM